MAPAFDTGRHVKVRRDWAPGHVRTPSYIRGCAGTIVAALGAFQNPEEVAYGRSGQPAQYLYRVRFRQRDVWPDYAGPPEDTLDVEIYQHWLEGDPRELA